MAYRGQRRRYSSSEESDSDDEHSGYKSYPERRDKYRYQQVINMAAFARNLELFHNITTSVKTSFLEAFAQRKVKFLETFIIKVHTVYTASIFTVFFTILLSSWFVVSDMHCKSKSDLSAMPEIYNEICRGQIYLEPHDDSNPLHLSNKLDGYHELDYRIRDSVYESMYEVHGLGRRTYDRHYIYLFKFLPWSLAVLIGVYILLGYLCKSQEDQDLNNLLQESDTAEKDDACCISELMVTKITKHFIDNLGCHNGLYSAYIRVHLICLAVDIISVLAIDILLQNRFIILISYYPWDRKMETFTDFLSMTFPPFVNCHIGEEHVIHHKMDLFYGCHLPSMQYIEKAIIFLWFYFAILISVTFCKTVQILLAKLLSVSGYYRQSYICTGGSMPRLEKVVAERASIGDLFALWRFRDQLAGSQFREVLKAMANKPGIYNRGFPLLSRNVPLYLPGAPAASPDSGMYESKCEE